VGKEGVEEEEEACVTDPPPASLRVGLSKLSLTEPSVCPVKIEMCVLCVLAERGDVLVVGCGWERAYTSERVRAVIASEETLTTDIKRFIRRSQRHKFPSSIPVTTCNIFGDI
jgi:hypothetical protein